ncbi:MAG: putative selenate ABC transporter substrate-binding protein [Pseudonocardiaceae bacterium]|nr:putative selenate ABC transporter substrate-binding protein [Pseudonocardiaceae bacterium]
MCEQRSVARCVVVVGVVAALSVVLAGCGADAPGGSGAAAPDGGDDVLTVGAIPDQDPQELQRRYGTVADYLADEVGVEVRFEPVTDYTASVTAFRRGDLDLVFYGGLTGVQAREQVPDARAIAQRDIDAEFRSVFITNTGAGVDPIADVSELDALAGKTFTFGSDVSTSGRLMPQFYLSEAGVDPADFDGQVGFSGSHDTTAKVVEAGSYQAGALSASVWDERVEAGEVDTTKVREVFRTPTYYDYHWVIRPDVDERLGDGTAAKVEDALLGLDRSDPRQRQVLELFQAEEFIPTKPENYRLIEQVAREAGLVE